MRFVRRTTKQLKSIEFSSVSVPRTHPGSYPRGVWARSKEGRAGSGPKVAVLCRAVNKKLVTFEGGVQERI